MMEMAGVGDFAGLMDEGSGEDTSEGNMSNDNTSNENTSEEE